jgi:hypothetical protein
MTSEPDSTSGPRPPTIELKATEVGVDKPDAAPQPGADDATAGDETQASSARPAAGSRAGGALLATSLAGLAGGVIAAVVIGTGLWFAGYIPPRAPAMAPSAGTPNDPAIADLSARVAKIENAPQAQPQPDPALASRLAAAEASAKSLGDQLAALNGRINDAAGAAQKAQAQAAAAAQSGAARSDLDALNARVAALESTVKKLADDVAHQPRSADDRAARLTVAAEALRAAVERGAPFAAELGAVKSFGADADATAALEPFATAGVPSAAALADELASLGPALQQAIEPAADKNSFLGRLETNARHLVTITPVDAPVGDDPTSVVTRIAVDAGHGDIAAALADIAKLPDAAKPLAAAWLQKAQAREAAIAASRKLAADALAALTKPNPQ